MESISPMTPYSTHLVPTITTAIHTHLLWPKSAILELGCGHYSTPLLSSIAKAQARDFQLIASDPKWAKQFQNDPNQLHLIDFFMWPRFQFKGEWGMVLVDHEELVINRYEQVFKLNEKAKVVLLHDAYTNINQHETKWNLIYLLYRYIYLYDRYFPATAILSNYVDPSKWF